MIIKDKKQLAEYKKITKISTDILRDLHSTVRIGITPLELDSLAAQLCKQHGVESAFFGVPGASSNYQYSTCIAVNDTVVHGIPEDKPLSEGDIITVDFGIKSNGYITDHCFTIGVGQLEPIHTKLIKTAKKAIQLGVKKAIVGNTTGDIGFAMQNTIERAGFSVVKEYVGHGIGHTLHDGPELPAYGNPGGGVFLKKGMVLCVEAQVNEKSDSIYLGNDGWTVKTDDGGYSAMFEYMVVVDDKKPIILTPTLDWSIISNL